MKLKIFTLMILISSICLYLILNKNTEIKQNQTKQLAILVDGEEVNNFPSKNVAIFEKVICHNGSTGEWNDDTWSLSMNFTTNDACIVYFTEMPVASEYLANLLETDDSLVNDDPDANIRYVGNNPNNYVLFNGEKWRIVGSLNNVKTTENGKDESRVKIIGPVYSNSLSYSNSGYNNWEISKIKTELNGTYYETLTEEAKSLIGDTVWNLGGMGDYKDSSNGLPQHFYTSEKGSNVYEGNPTTWTGKIALMYASDYGYATNGGNQGRNFCLTESLYNWYGGEYNNCHDDNYLYSTENNWWTLTTSLKDSYVYLQVMAVSCTMKVALIDL